MRTVWKFQLQIGAVNAIDLPPQAKVVLAALDPASGAPALWIEVEGRKISHGIGSEPVPPTAPDLVRRRFVVCATGAPVDEDEEHVGSMIDRSFVWHIYERRT